MEAGGGGLSKHLRGGGGGSSIPYISIAYFTSKGKGSRKHVKLRIT